MAEEADKANRPADENPEQDTDAAAGAPGPEAGGDAEQPAETPLFRPGMGWYVLRVASNREDQVKTALERKVKIEKLEDHIGRVVVPAQKEKRMRGGTARVVERKLYPGYVFVEMATESDGSISEDVWFMIKETSGVGDFIGSEGKPSPMQSHEVEGMLKSVLAPEDTPELANVNFKIGDRVKVTEGPFENTEGTVDELNSQKGTVRVIATIFGRPTPIELEYWQVERLE